MSGATSLLFYAVAANLPEMIAPAFEQGADPAARNSVGATALAAAARHGRVQCLRELLPRSDPRAVDPQGENPLMLAATEGCVDCARELLPHSDPSAVDGLGLNALMKAARRGNFGAVMELLNATPAGMRDASGKTALAWAVWAGDLDCVKALMLTEDPNQADADGNSALASAIAKGWEEGTMCLAEASDLTKKNRLGADPGTQAKALGLTDLSSHLEREQAARQEARLLSEELGAAPSVQGPDKRL